MGNSEGDVIFQGSIPKLYERYLVPMVFEPFAEILADQLRSRPLSRLLEIAAGTGVVTRALAKALPENVAIVATDLNEPMIECAKSVGTSRPVEWCQANAMQLPFGNEEFDAVVCQFGVMFFPDKTKAFSEVYRILRSGGVFVFDVWDRIEENEFAHTVTTALESLFRDDPPRFHARVPHGYHNRVEIERDLAAANFHKTPQFTTVTTRSYARSPRDPAMAYCQGTPLRNEIEVRDPALLGDATIAAEKALAERFGDRDITGKIQARILVVER
jgi:SAM-dependent methyltransferase